MPELSLDYPVLLGPVRVETRYTENELLIRVFPDEWSVNKFEPRPTAAELAALDAYWTALWRSGGRQVAEQAAWQELVRRIPVGRAGYLLGEHRPANPGDRPIPVPVDTTVLVVVSALPPPAADRQPAVDYWTAVWGAHGDRAKLRQADIALLAAVGPSRAEAIRGNRPSGVDGAPVTLGDKVVVAFLVLTPPPPDKIAPQSWTVAAKATLLPDRFTALGYVGGELVFAKTGEPVSAALAVSPDPLERKEDQLRIDETTGKLTVPPALRWLTDFDQAVTEGMGLRIPLLDGFRCRVDRLIVLGLREQATAEDSAAAFGRLLLDHHRSPGGFSLVPQGTPTNNTEQAPAGQSPRAEAAAALRTAAGLEAADDWTTRTDGRRFADLLGLDPAVLTGVPNADATDHRDARAAHTALWPATWGYYLQALLDGVLDDEQIAETRRLFLEHVSGRGPLPAVKIGRQPYGILPTTAFRKMAWPGTAKHRIALNTVLTEAAKDWEAVLSDVAYLGKPGDRHQMLLDILALHPTSAEYYQRYAQSVEDIFNRENFRALGPEVPGALERGAKLGPPIRALLARFGRPTSDPDRDPDLLRRLFTGVQHPLLAPLVDDRPLSETDPIRSYTADKRNYLRWLADHAGTDLDRVRTEEGFRDGKPPAALLYLLARHAVLLGWADAARRLALATPGDEFVPGTTDAPFVHVKVSATTPSESRYRKLYSADQRMTGDPNLLVHEHIRRVLATDPATAELAEQRRALELLAGLPTARLERVLAEHLDLATYRLDAWRLGLVNERLAELRFGTGGADSAGGVHGAAPARRGLYLGAYGWLEHIERRCDEQPALAPVSDDLAHVFGADPIPQDPGNGGYIHAPSPAHARTAAVLRAGYLANHTPGRESAFAVNLSSQRVRIALSLLDGLRQGQSLGALLGYRFERGLHDRDPRAKVDQFIAGLRLKFPLRANKIGQTAAPPDDPARPRAIEQVEARNVIDGLELIRHVSVLPDAQKDYPYDFTDLPPADGDQKKAIRAEVKALLDTHDALADLAVAEGAHQALQGNTERASATLDAYAKEGFPPDPAVVQTPRSGITLTHRIGIQFRPGLDPDHGAVRNNPRARAEPAVNDWLPAVLPLPTEVAVLVTWTEPGGGQGSRVVTQSDIGLQPIDLLWALRPAGAPEMSDLDDRILGVVYARSRPRPDARPTINYTRRVAGKVSFFELSALVTALRSLLVTARPLQPSDLVPAAGAATVNRSADDAVALPRDRPAAVLESLTEFRGRVEEFLAELAELYPAEADPVRAEVLKRIDALLAGYAGLAMEAGGFGMVRSGWAELAEWRRGVFAGVLAAVAETAARMGRARDAADALLRRYDGLPSSATDEQRFLILQEAERLLTTTPTDPRPGTPFELRSSVRRLRRDFGDLVDDLVALAATTETTLSGLLAKIAGLPPVSDHDPTGLDLAPFQDRIVDYGRELRTRAQALETEIKNRAKAAEDALRDYDAAVTGPDRVRAATTALKALLGEDVLVVPEFTPEERLAEDLRDAVNDSDRLIAHLKPARDFPVDDWLHGIARVREKPRLWERAVLLADALLGPGGLLNTGILGWKEPALKPIQLPYAEGDHWLALELANDPARPDPFREDRLLYTAHYAAAPPLGGGPQCGLLLDEWTEVIPAERETTGIALHINGPDSEPPQAMLLVVPPVRDEQHRGWTAEDLVQAIAETFELAKIRAVEPQHLDGTAYAHLLPATVMSAAQEQITISTDLATANLRWKADHA
ncbi:hypothetical protein [Actinomadura rubrisoli]|uniref:Uncharacterized protein n=1 Tax=Actinomadura rubrisoli TaxID=2530368 RepID=A0A4R5BTB6_9ACTN|nr:hypothetical protein [Actinomadura rubrisoli]TDD89279.1 hypothetical protein E1298_14380 [Actinomadura rubrisoli]